MARITLIPPLLGGLLILSSCAESIHQIERTSGYFGVPPELEQQIDRSVKLADLRAAPANYIGRVVTVGGIVIASKRKKQHTEIEILELPTRSDGPSTRDRLQSEGRFLAVREEFLDPASVPAGTPVTIIGVVTGSTTKPLDESEYTYPVLAIKHLIDWNSVASRDSEGGAAAYYGPYYPPYGYWGPTHGYYPYYGGPYPVIIAPPRPSSPPPPPPPPQNIPPRFRPR